MEQIKSQAEQAAAAQGVSLNSWVAQAVQGALAGADGGTTAGTGRGDRDERRQADGSGVSGGGDTTDFGTDDRAARGAGTPAELADRQPRRAGADGRRRPHAGACSTSRRGHRRGQRGDVRVEVRHDPTAGDSWTQGLTGIINWLRPRRSAAIGRSATARRRSRARRGDQLVGGGAAAGGTSSTELPLRVVPLAVTVTAPARSRLAVRAGSGDVRVTGRAGWAAVRTGSGEVAVAAVDGDADISTGSGGIEVGPVAGRARVRTGSGQGSRGRAPAARRRSGPSSGAVAGRRGATPTSACAPARATSCSPTPAADAGAHHRLRGAADRRAPRRPRRGGPDVRVRPGPQRPRGDARWLPSSPPRSRCAAAPGAATCS